MSFSYAVSLPDFTVLADQQGNTVVNISSIKNAVNKGNRQLSPQEEHMKEFFNRFGIPMPPGMGPNDQQQKQMSATGSGFILESDGYIITNAHVVGEADSIIVKLADKREFQAKLLGIDKRTDVALLKINAKDLQAVKIGNPKNIKVGEWVAAIGSPFGLENTMTVGVISAKGRALPQENFVPFIQTDVAINPGNSGGPLFNTNGEVIGINSQIYSRTGGYMGLSFAIPIDVAMDVADQLKMNGRVVRGWLGIAIQVVTDELKEALGLKDNSGALVAAVNKNTPAGKAGIEAGDVILKFNNKVIALSSDLPKYVGMTKPNKVVPVQIWRNGKTKILRVKIGEMPIDKMQASNKKTIKESVNRIGLVLKESGAKDKKMLDGRNGLVVMKATGQAVSSQIRTGDIILALNNTPVTSVRAFNREINKTPKGKTIALLIFRNGDTLFVPVKVIN
ncbi:MAG: Do family serine endopeptidase [Nitrosomonadales bacterium]|nr:Do family serine endopeptidase [Nitrosomonadales bacterium]MBT3918683.1 Do family serine endopeptidase [Nitrosomonadales bacterium]MBT4182770.1 Do family serine endopeptidase [Nitrosomonadales bacterium]MBT4571048.1 Do family serine endopeptidase [Nitrosomonadales bacterium]MBT4759648.1 Do family serine endopeptidase [Nitrosomonadales bacterium]